MSESATPGIAEGAAGGSASPLSQEARVRVLADFETWLSESLAPAEAAGPEAADEVDLHTLLGQFLALRHEVNLQTKATRTQQEQNAETLRQLTVALETLQETPTSVPNDETSTALLKTLM